METLTLVLIVERAFQHAIDEAVKAYGIDGKGRDKALRKCKYLDAPFPRNVRKYCLNL